MLPPNMSTQHILWMAILIGSVRATNYYYSMYRSYGTGDTIINTYHGSQRVGTALANHKWVVECFDGEAAIGISDNIWDFAALSFVWCKFMFPHKPPSQGLYPYYKNCHVLDYNKNYFCYQPQNHTTTINGFIVGMWDNDWVYWTFSPSDVYQPYKCCSTPPGYYIDYVSCYYLPTHDVYWEYYDGNLFLVNCATGYVMTGIATKINPIARERHVDWIQCCRVGFGSVIALPPPVIQKPGRPPAYLSSHYVAPSQIPPGYRHQYRKKRSVPQYTDLVDAGNSTSGFQEVELAEDVPSYARKNFVSRDFNIHDHDVPLSDMRDLHEPLYQTLGVDGF